MRLGLTSSTAIIIGDAPNIGRGIVLGFIKEEANFYSDACRVGEFREAAYSGCKASIIK